MAAMGDTDNQSAMLAERLNALFAANQPLGRPYTNREVADRINAAAGTHVISVQYLSYLRRGERVTPSFEKLAAVARFFDVDLRYFTDGTPRDPRALVVANALDGLSESALRGIMNLAVQLREAEGLPPVPGM